MITLLAANGKMGRAAARELPSETRLLTRSDADLRDSSALARALSGSSAVLVICPIDLAAPDVALAGDELARNICAALKEARPGHVVAISDYGAQHPGATGIPAIFHRFEARLRDLPSPCTILRSAEHMQNWLRFPRNGVVPIFYPEGTAPRPFVSAADVGLHAARLLRGEPQNRILHIEGPRRYSKEDVAAALGGVPHLKEPGAAIPHPSLARLLEATFRAHHEGLIEPDGEVLRGETELVECLSA